MLITIPFTIKDANIVACNVVENDYPIHSMTTTYGLNDLVITTGVDEHRVWRSVHGVTVDYPSGNIGYSPLAELDLDNPVHWSLVGATNKYKMIDGYVSSQTINPESITLTVKDLGIVNTLALIGCEGAYATIDVVDSVDGLVYSESVDLVSYSSITSYYTYYFSPVYRKNFAVFENIPPYLNATITLTIFNPSGDAKLGAFVGGYGTYFGSLKFGSRVKNKSFSIKQQLATGDYFFQKGNVARLGDFQFDFPNEQFDLLQNLLKQLDTVPTLFIAYSEYEYTLFYGIVIDDDTTLSYVLESTCQLKLESLI